MWVVPGSAMMVSYGFLIYFTDHLKGLTKELHAG